MADLLPDLASWVIDQLTAAHPGIPVSKRRPPSTTNHEGPWVRLTQTGGPTSWSGAIWQPGLALEAWADTSDEAFDLCAAVTRTLEQLEGAVQAGVFHLAEVQVVTACADSAIDQQPVCLTTATTTVQVTP